MSVKLALVTGASRGIGQGLCQQLQNQGYQVLGVCRSKPVAYVDQWIPCDLNQTEDRLAMIETLTANPGNLEVCVLNAGMGCYATWEQTTFDDVQTLFGLNFFANVDLVQRLLPRLKSSCGTFIFISSVAGRMPIPGMGLYCATKYALNVMADSLRAELKPSGVHVINCIVGRIDTGFSEFSRGTLKAPPTPGAGSVSVLSRKILTALRKRSSEVVYPFWYQWLILFTRVMPRTYEKVALWPWRKQNPDEFPCESS